MKFKQIERDIFDWLSESPMRVIVVPTNTDVRSDRRAVMGADLARQAADHFKTADLPGEYGQMLLAAGDQRAGRIWASERAPVIYLPTKLSWRKAAVPELIRRNVKALGDWLDEHPLVEVGIPPLGAGLGGLDRDESLKLISALRSKSEQVTLVDSPDPAAPTGYSDGLRVLLMGKRVLVVTGHRPDKLGGYGEDVRAHLVHKAKSVLRDFEPEIVVHGGALGVDSAFAEAAQELKIPTIMAEPCLSHSSKWNDKDRARHARQGRYAESTGARVIVHNAPYGQIGPRCMQSRNEWMLGVLDHAGEESRVACVWDHSDGGTANCLRAMKQRFGAAKYLGNYYKRFLAGHPAPKKLPGSAQVILEGLALAA